MARHFHGISDFTVMSHGTGNSQRGTFLATTTTDRSEPNLQAYCIKMRATLSKALYSIFLLLALLAPTAGAEESPFQSTYDYLKQKYDDLPENGKLATGAVAGYGVSRVAIKSAVTVVKVAGAAFVATEALNAAGILDEIKFPDAYSDSKENLKRRALTAANGFRNGVRERLKPETLKNFMETDRMASIGFASGAFLGFVL